MTTFDGPNTTIILDVPVGDTLNIDVKTLYSEWKDWVRTGDNAKYLPAFRVVGGDPLTPGINAGSYFFLQNQDGWRVKGGDKDQTIFYNGNLVPENSSVALITPTAGFTVTHIGIQPVTQSVEQILTTQQSSTFQGSVAIDTVDGSAGTAYPIGTQSAPVNNLNDAFTIANREGLFQFTLRNSLTLDRDVSGYAFRGVSTSISDQIDLNNQAIDDCGFYSLSITGQQASGRAQFVECRLSNVLALDGNIFQCSFQGTSSFANAASVVMADCYSGIGGVGAPVFDLTGAGAANIAIREWNGGIEVTNGTDPNLSMTIGLQTGNPIIGQTNTAGVVVLRGRGQQESSIDPNGMTVLTDGAEFPADARLVRKIMTNRMETDPGTGQIRIYDDDDVTILLQGNIYEDVLAATAYRGRGVERRDKLA